MLLDSKTSPRKAETGVSEFLKDKLPKPTPIRRASLRARWAIRYGKARAALIFLAFQ